MDDVFQHSIHFSLTTVIFNKLVHAHPWHLYSFFDDNANCRVRRVILQIDFSTVFMRAEVRAGMSCWRRCRILYGIIIAGYLPCNVCMSWCHIRRLSGYYLYPSRLIFYVILTLVASISPVTSNKEVQLFYWSYRMDRNDGTILNAMESDSWIALSDGHEIRSCLTLHWAFFRPHI